MENLGLHFLSSREPRNINKLLKFYGQLSEFCLGQLGKAIEIVINETEKMIPRITKYWTLALVFLQ